MVLTTFSFLQFLYNLQIFIKNQDSYWLPHFSYFFNTPKPPKFTTTKFSYFVTPTFSLERCCKNQFRHSHAAWEAFFFVIRTQRGSTIFAFCDTSPARRRFFSCFRHLPSVNQKKSTKSYFEAMVSTRRRGSRQKQIGSKLSYCSVKYDRDAFFKSPKN